MPTIIHRLDEDKEAWEILHDMCVILFLDSECYAFAMALHQGLGWPMVGLMVGDVIRHAAVQSPDGRLHDARGFISEEEFGYFSMPPYVLRTVSVDDLHRNGESSRVRDGGIWRARKIAETLWPELPWKESLASRVSTFADELEALSRKHKIWIRGPAPGTKPVIALGEDDEGGYELHPTHDSITFTIDRYFPSS